jgi:uncharacterized repeat protein (TIGR03803 family)
MANVQTISRLNGRSALIALTPFVLLALFTFITGTVQAQTYTVLYEFKGVPDGYAPAAGLFRDAKGNLYGTTSAGGAHKCKNNNNLKGCGTVFKVDTAGKESVLYSFDGQNGQYPVAGLAQDAQGNLYGTTKMGGSSGLGTAFKLTSKGKETVLHNFDGGATGSLPEARFLQDSTGNLYSTTFSGGNSTQSGVVFKVDKTGHVTVPYTYTCYSCYGESGGGFGMSSGSVIRDSAGNFYGGGFGGPPSGQCQNAGCGAVYKINKAGVGTILYAFTGGTDGMWFGPGDVAMDAAGNIYGTTAYGGNTGCSYVGFGCGIVFKVDPKGNETVLHTFTGGLDGGFPNNGVVLDSKGNVYGTTRVGGRVNAPACYNRISGNGCGVVFRVDQNGTETTLYAFKGLKDGGGPNADIIRDAAGNFYGTTAYGGKNNNGVVFKIAP